MATAFLAMNQVYGRLFDMTPAETATPEMADERAASLQDQFIFDGHTHFLRDDTRPTGFVKMRQAVSDAGWNPALKGDLGQLFAASTVAHPKLAAYLVGWLIRGLGFDHVVCGYGCSVDRFTAVANRGTEAARNTGRCAEAVRIQASRTG
jgi:hypothetical protein